MISCKATLISVAVFDLGYHLALCGSARAKLVGYDPLRRTALFVQEPILQPLRGFCAPANLHNLAEDIAPGKP